MCYKPFEKYNKQMGIIEYFPCRQCLECRQQRAKEWALRCMFESKDHEQSCFITLTYEEKYNPVRLVKSHLQDFIKRLRKSIEPLRIRYFACGEYGSKNYRPHFHILIFGYDFEDVYLDRMSERGYPIYTSRKLDKLWGMGLTTVQEVTKNSSAYCALYASKYKSCLPEHLKDYPEFNTMSKGLGVPQILRKIDIFLQTDEIWLDGVKHGIPKICLKKHYLRNDLDGEPYQWKIERSRTMDNLLFSRKCKGIFTKRLAMSELNDDYHEYLLQKKIRKENAIKRLTKKI